MAGLNRDLVKLNSVLRMKRGQESTRAAEVKRPRLLASALPEWLKAGSQCCYVSKTQGWTTTRALWRSCASWWGSARTAMATAGSTHRVRVQKVDERQQLVTIFFDEARWKKVPFAECTKSMDATLRPVWKAKEQPVASGAPATASAASTAGAVPAPAPAAPGAAPAGAGPGGSPAPGVEEVVSSDEGEAPPPPAAAGAPRQAPPEPLEDPYGLGGGGQQPKLVTPNLLVPRAVALSQGKKAEQKPRQHGRR